MILASAPSPAVLAAFGLVGSPVRLVGGQGLSWRVGEVVLKLGVDPEFQEWLGTEVAGIQQQGFCLPAVRRAVDGAWVVDGWAAQSVVPGSIATGGMACWRAVIGAARDLHAATAALARPAFVDLRTDPWALADRAVWGETPRETVPELLGVVQRLDAVLLPLGPAQVVHGDLTSNVFLVPGGPPSIIDFSPYWRSPSYAEGIVIADALCWHAATPRILKEVDVPVPAIARGLLFRVLTTSRVHLQHSAELRRQATRYQSVVAALDL